MVVDIILMRIKVLKNIPLSHLSNSFACLCYCRLSDCAIHAEDCKSLFSALHLNPSHLRELDLSFNPLGESGIFLLSEALQNPQCRLETLKYVQDQI